MGEMEPFPGGGRYTTTFPEDEGKRCAPVEAVVSGRAENLFFGMEPFPILVRINHYVRIWAFTGLKSGAPGRFRV